MSIRTLPKDDPLAICSESWSAGGTCGGHGHLRDEASQQTNKFSRGDLMRWLHVARFALISFCAVALIGCSPSLAVEGSWASPVQKLHLTDIKSLYAVLTFRRDGKVELLTYGSVVLTIPGDYASHMLLAKSIGTYATSGATVTLTGLEGATDTRTWTVEISGNLLRRSQDGTALPTLSRVPFVSRYGATE